MFVYDSIAQGLELLAKRELQGAESQFLNVINDPFSQPEETKRALEKLKEISVLFGQAQIDAGADALTFPDHATGDLVSGAYYKEFLQDIHTEMVDVLDVPLILHICGKTVDRMPYIAQTGMASFHFDLITYSTFNAIQNLSIEYNKPIGNGIITAFNINQAKIRSEGSNNKKPNKGSEAANAVISILNNGPKKI